MFGKVPRHNNQCAVHCRLGVEPGRLVPGEEYKVVAVEDCSLKL